MCAILLGVLIDISGILIEPHSLFFFPYSISSFRGNQGHNAGLDKWDLGQSQTSDLYL